MKSRLKVIFLTFCNNGLIAYFKLTVAKKLLIKLGIVKVGNEYVMDMKMFGTAVCLEKATG